MGCGCGCAGDCGQSGLGNYPEDCSNCLTTAQVQNFLASNPVGNQAVLTLIETGFWPDGNPGPVGYAVQDPTFGNVLIAEDANGLIYYLASNLPAAQPGTVNKPPYQSPPGGPPGPTVCPGWSHISSLEDFLACAGQSITTLEWVFLGVAGWFIYREFRR